VPDRPRPKGTRFALRVTVTRDCGMARLPSSHPGDTRLRALDYWLLTPDHPPQLAIVLKVWQNRIGASWLEQRQQAPARH